MVYNAQIDIIEEFWAIEFFYFILKTTRILSINKEQLNDFGFRMDSYCIMI
jgi:hypothetical protein